MCHLEAVTVLDQEMSADEIRQARAVLEAMVSGYRAARLKFDACEEITDLLKGSTILQRKTHQTGNHVVEADQFRGTVSAFDAKKGFGRMFVVMDADVKRTLAGNF